MEDVPVLICPLHPIKEAEADVARALTPTKIIPLPSVSPDVLVLPGNIAIWKGADRFIIFYLIVVAKFYLKKYKLTGAIAKEKLSVL